MPVYDMCEGYPQRTTPKDQDAYSPEIDFAGWHPDVGRLLQPAMQEMRGAEYRPNSQQACQQQAQPNPAMIARLLRSGAF